MPIYTHSCPSCGHTQDHLLKMSGSLDTCPSCSHKGYSKQLSAPAFVLKGSGYYATDFKSKPPAPQDAKSPCSGGCPCHPS